LLMQGEPNRIDPGKWRPLIMSFQKYYGLAPEELHGSRLGTVPEELYRSPESLGARSHASQLEGSER
jgi:hypothetical protein